MVDYIDVPDLSPDMGYMRTVKRRTTCTEGVHTPHVIARSPAAGGKDWRSNAILTTATSVPLALAPGTGKKLHLTAIQFKNTQTLIATEILVLDGTTTIWRGHASIAMLYTDSIDFPTPLIASDNAPLAVKCGTAGANVYFNAQGFID